MSLPPGIPSSSRRTLSNESRRVTSWISVTVTEGKNRQVRRMTAAVGHPTLRLVRVRIGSITLEGMSEGDVRRLDQTDIESFAIPTN
jgi:23S rRNA pseudouridine2457 synthase